MNGCRRPPAPHYTIPRRPISKWRCRGRKGLRWLARRAPHHAIAILIRPYSWSLGADALPQNLTLPVLIPAGPEVLRWALLRMRNAKPAAKEFRLYDHALTSTSGVRIRSATSVEGLARGEQISNSQDRVTEHRGHPAAGLACQTFGRLKRRDPLTLHEWQRRRRELAGAQQPDAARHRDHPRPTRSI